MRGNAILAILLNPPSSSSGRRTLGAVARAASVLGYDAYDVANLCSSATPSVVELTDEPNEAWDSARANLQLKIQESPALLAGWGLGGLSGQAQAFAQQQIQWVVDNALKAGHTKIWTVAGAPRHPSRWHQYVADRHGRTTGGPFEQRLAEVLAAVPLAGFANPAGSARAFDIQQAL